MLSRMSQSNVSDYGTQRGPEPNEFAFTNGVKEARCKKHGSRSLDAVPPNFRSIQAEIGVRPCITLEDRHFPAQIANLTSLVNLILSDGTFEFIRSLDHAYYIAFPGGDSGVKAAVKCYRKCTHEFYDRSLVRVTLFENGLTHSSPSGRLWYWDATLSANGSQKHNSTVSSGSPSHSKKELAQNNNERLSVTPQSRQSDIVRILNQPDQSSNGHDKSQISPTLEASDGRPPKRRKVTPWIATNSMRFQEGFNEGYPIHEMPLHSFNNHANAAGATYPQYNDEMNPGIHPHPPSRSLEPSRYNLHHDGTHIQHPNYYANGGFHNGYPTHFDPRSPAPFMISEHDMNSRFHHHRPLWPKSYPQNHYAHYPPVELHHAPYPGPMWNYKEVNGAVTNRSPLSGVERTFVNTPVSSTTQKHTSKADEYIETSVQLQNNHDKTNGDSSTAVIDQQDSGTLPAFTSQSPKSAQSNRSKVLLPGDENEQADATSPMVNHTPNSLEIKSVSSPGDKLVEANDKIESKPSAKQHELRNIRPSKVTSTITASPGEEKKDTVSAELEPPGKHYDLIKEAIEKSETQDLDANEITHRIMEKYTYYRVKYSFDECLNSVSATLSQRKKKGDFIKHDPLPSSGNKRCRWSLASRTTDEIDSKNDPKPTHARFSTPEHKFDNSMAVSTQATASRSFKIPSAQDYHVKANFTEMYEIIPMRKGTTPWEQLHNLDAAKQDSQVFRAGDFIVVRPSTDDEPHEFAVIKSLKALEEEGSAGDGDGRQYIAASIFWCQSKVYSMRKAGSGRKLATEWPEGFEYIRTNALDIVNLGAFERKANKKELGTIYQGPRILDSANNAAKIRDSDAKEVAWTIRSPQQQTRTHQTNNKSISSKKINRSLSDAMVSHDKKLINARSSSRSLRRNSAPFPPEFSGGSREMERAKYSRYDKSARATSYEGYNAKDDKIAALKEEVKELNRAYAHAQALLVFERQRRLKAESTIEEMKAFSEDESSRSLSWTMSERDAEEFAKRQGSDLLRSPSQESEWLVFDSLRDALKGHTSTTTNSRCANSSSAHHIKRRESTLERRGKRYKGQQQADEEVRELAAMGGLKRSTAGQILLHYEKRRVRERTKYKKGQYLPETYIEIEDLESLDE